MDGFGVNGGVGVGDLMPGRIYDIRIRDLLVASEHFQPGEIKRRRYLGPFDVDGTAFIEVTDLLRGDHLIPVELIAEIRPVEPDVLEVCCVE
jgi:hypothetical protein